MNYKKIFFAVLTGIMIPVIADDGIEPAKKLSQREKIEEELRQQKLSKEAWECELNKKMERDGILDEKLRLRRMNEDPLIVALIEDISAANPKKVSKIDDVISEGKIQWNKERASYHIKIAGTNYEYVYKQMIYYNKDQDYDCVLADEKNEVDKNYDEKIATLVAFGQRYKNEVIPVFQKIFTDKAEWLDGVHKSHGTDIAAIKGAITESLRKKRCEACLDYKSAVAEYDAMVSQSLNDFIDQSRKAGLPLYYEEGQTLLRPIWEKIQPLIEEKYNLCNGGNGKSDQE